MGILLGFIVFNIIVLVHEFGHYIFAKKAGVYVEEFAFGIGPTIIGKRIGETKFGIKLLPFGGCCMMKGEEDGADMSEDSFNAKSKWQRFLILFAGPFFNIVLAFICAVILTAATGISKPVIGGYTNESSAARKAGISVNSEILKLDDENITMFKDISFFNLTHKENADVLVVYKDETGVHSKKVTREKTNDGTYALGILPNDKEKGSLFEVIKYSSSEIGFQLKMVKYSLVSLVSGKISLNDLSGPVGIVKAMGDGYKEVEHNGFIAVLLIMFNYILFLSANIGVMNLLPIPALDGGRIVFILIECLLGKKIEKEAEINAVSLIILLGLMVLVMAKDIISII